ncbi:hypothetical protein BDQ17DRAFT_1413940 [Cyathus striatus]|nr:hypothetical protein BDQ17DRAFT_1413940 [Cyathus striatus]
MILLITDTLRLMGKHRSGHCGKNNAGKFTLMRAITNIGGFPSPGEVCTFYVEHRKVQRNDAQPATTSNMSKRLSLPVQGSIHTESKMGTHALFVKRITHANSIYLRETRSYRLLPWGCLPQNLPLS